MTETPSTPPVCSYEGSGYEADFWQGQGRDYEDLVERIAVRRLLPPTGKRILEIGAGFGRLTDELSGYDHVVLLDYSRSLLRDARERLGDEGYTYVAADIYKMPFQPGQFDAATMIRVIHHIADVPVALDNIQRSLAPGANFLLEFANKRNLKALLRRALGRQDWSPNSLEPVEFVPLNFDFHPTYMQIAVREAGFDINERIPVSFFRLGALKRTVPTNILVALDRMLQNTSLLYAPSIFTANTRKADGPDNVDSEMTFYCPICRVPLAPAGEAFACTQDGCNVRWGKRDGIYDFKEPL